MIRRDLRVSIVISLVLFFLLGMVLLDFVVISTQQRMLIQKERERGMLFLSFLRSTMTAESNRRTGDAMELTGIVRNMFQHTGFSCVLIADGDQSVLKIGRFDFDDRQMLQWSQEAGEKNHTIDRFQGSTWGVFWPQPRYLVLAAPLTSRAGKQLTASIAADLGNVFSGLRRVQAILLIYILANTIVLTFIGFYRISSLTVKPLQKLVKRADEYRDDDDFFFLQERGENEYTRLSRSLNRMVSRISKDRDDLKQAVRHLEAANLDLKNAQESVIRAEKLASVGRLTSGIAHEIGNPVGIVTGYLDLLRGGGLDESEQIAYLQRAQSEMERIRKILRDLLDFSRPNDSVETEFSCHDVIRSTVNSLSPQPLLTGIEIRMQFDANAGILIGDPDHFRQVMLNLILNAADAVQSVHAESGGEILVKTKDFTPSDPGGAWFQIQVSDNGAGISAADMANIFDPFFTTKETGRGTGLGLAVSYMIIERMGGRMTAESDPGKGTTIRIQLPLREAASEDSYRREKM